MFSDIPGDLGWVGDGGWEAIHADWPAYPGDRSWALALLRLGDFPQGTRFTCIDVIDQCALLVAEVGIRNRDQFDEGHMHLAVRPDELAELDDRELLSGIDFDTSLSPDQMHMKRTLGPDRWEQARSGDLVLGMDIDGEFRPLAIPEDEPWDGFGPAPRIPELMAIFPGVTQVHLLAKADAEIEHIGRQTLAIPPSVQPRIVPLLAEGLFDSAIRDLGAALEMRMRAVTQGEGYGFKLIERYVANLMATDQYLPARIKSLRQELRSIFKFVRNEFAHNLVNLPPGRGYALVSRMCWHVRDVELVADRLGIELSRAGDLGRPMRQTSDRERDSR